MASPTMAKRETGSPARAAPASPPTREAVARGVELVSSWGLQVEVGRHVFDRVGYLAGDDQARLADANEALVGILSTLAPARREGRRRRTVQRNGPETYRRTGLT